MPRSLRDSLLQSLMAKATQQSDDAVLDAPLSVLSQRVSIIAETMRPTSQTRSQKAKFDQMIRRSHYADQTDYLISKGITTNSQGSELDSESTETMMRRREVPTKKAGKKTKLTRSTSLSFNSAALQGVPGGSRGGRTNLPAMMWADETGTQVVDDIESNAKAAALLRRLSNTAKNCDTTRQNYIV